MNPAIVSILSRVAKDIDLEALFSALPEDEFAKMIDDRMERIADEKRVIAASQERIAQYTREAESFRAALRVKRELESRRHDQEAHDRATEPGPAVSPRELMRRKRAAVLRVFSIDSDRALSPEQVEAAIRVRGLLTEAELGTGTPIRIVMAKLAAAHTLTRARPGEYKLAAAAAHENGTTPRVHIEGPPSPQKPPPEDVANPPVGLPFEAEQEP